MMMGTREESLVSGRRRGEEVKNRTAPYVAILNIITILLCAYKDMQDFIG